MSIAHDMVSSALRKVGVLASGETAQGEEADETLEIMNDILEQWSLEDLMIYCSTVLTLPLTAGINNYTVGPTGDLVAVRPIEILQANLRTADLLDLPISILDFENYQGILQKATDGTLPQYLAYQPTAPDGTLYLWQSPSSGLSVRMTVAYQFLQVADLSTDVVLPIGYKKAIQDALTVELCIKNGRTAMLAEVKESAAISKMNIKRKNAKKTTMRLMAEFLPGNNGIYNPYSDT